MNVDVDDLKALIVSADTLGRGGTMIGTDIANIEVETIEKMSPDVKQIFVKIRD